VADQNGVFSRVWADFGDKHLVHDKNGEELVDCMIKQISAVENAKNAKVELLPGAQWNGPEEGDTVQLKEVIGMTEVDSGESVNGKQFKVVEVISKDVFVIEIDPSKYSSYERNGVVRQVKTSTLVQHNSIEQLLKSSADSSSLDQNLFYHDFNKLQN